MQAEEQPGLIYEPREQQSKPKVGELTHGCDQSAYPRNTGYQYPLCPKYSKAREHTICGMRAATFWLFLALVIVTVVVAVGGGVGGSLAVNNAKTQCLQSNALATQVCSAVASALSANSSSISTSMTSSSSVSSAASTSVSTTAWGPLATSQAYTGCPVVNNTVDTSTLNPSNFQIVCGMNIPFTNVSDLIYAVTPTYELCMELCASWNDQGMNHGNATVLCKGISFSPAQINGDANGNPIDCVLKSYATEFVVKPQFRVYVAILL